MCNVFLCILTVVHWPVFKVFNLSADVNACEFMWGVGVGWKGGSVARTP